MEKVDDPELELKSAREKAVRLLEGEGGMIYRAIAYTFLDMFPAVSMTYANRKEELLIAIKFKLCSGEVDSAD